MAQPSVVSHGHAATMLRDSGGIGAWDVSGITVPQGESPCIFQPKRMAQIGVCASPASVSVRRRMAVR